MKIACYSLIVLTLLLVFTGLTGAVGPGEPKKGRIFFVRQTVGNDSNDGLSAQKAWQSLSKLEKNMQAGDTVYIGPGLYREMITVTNSGTPEAPITFIGDTAGQHTGDPPGVVMITGADPMDETVFVPQPTPGLYKAVNLQGHSLRLVEMDGPQYRYKNVGDTVEHLREGMPLLEVVARLASTYHYDRDAGTLYIHTSDDRPPTKHEIELIRRNYGIVTYGNHHISVIGFTFRHMGIAGINFGKSSSNCIALDNTSYGSWQGIRVSDSSNVRVEGNTLFRNGNSGVYFLSESRNSQAVRNISYENAKGVRWSSDSANGVALENVTFDNHEVGISIESTNEISISNNIIVNNRIYQLLVRKSSYTSEANCYETRGAKQLIAKVDFHENYKTLAEYQQATKQDLSSREECGQLPQKLNVHELHRRTKNYSERARRILAERDK